jgi:hypothetical protein
MLPPPTLRPPVLAPSSSASIPVVAKLVNFGISRQLGAPSAAPVSIWSCARCRGVHRAPRDATKWQRPCANPPAWSPQAAPVGPPTVGREGPSDHSPALR